MDPTSNTNDTTFVALSQLLLDNPGPATAAPPSLSHAHMQEDFPPTTYPTCTFPPAIPAKQGTRFTTQTLHTLRSWLSTHASNPYPRAEDVRFLKMQTGLEGRQIANWFANARRRGFVGGGGAVGVGVGVSGAVDIVARPGTPAVRSPGPLQRWVESPPEMEAAGLGDIVRAVARGAGGLSDGEYDPGMLCSSSSASSVATSHSNAQSDWDSSGSQGSRVPARKMRRRRRLKKVSRSRGGFDTAVLPYQCTFCVETFKTKYDWQRHEKALHLSLDQWRCAPQGPRVPVPNAAGVLCCVFCGQVSPDDAHLETHQYSACQTRVESERSFYRKDHLVQHLRLVHKVDTSQVPLDQWVASTLDIKSRCGFCGIGMDTWAARADHLADHFKAGALIKQWQGDWGFEEHILKRVEDSVPPYLIDFEKNTPFPLRASETPTATPLHAHELLKLELNFFHQTHLDTTGHPPSDTAMHLEACRTVLASEALSNRPFAATPQPDSSWLRDLILSNPTLTQEALFGPLRMASDGVSTLRVYGRTHLFQHCPLETALRAFAQAHPADAEALPDWRLQQEACALLLATESETDQPHFSTWARRKLTSDTAWLVAFQLRTGLPISTSTSISMLTPTPAAAPPPPQTPYATPQFTPQTPYAHSHLSQGPNYFRLFTADLARWVSATMSPSNPACHVPSDAEIQHHARWIMYESDDLWLQTAADHGVWLERFKRDVGIIGGGGVD